MEPSGTIVHLAVVMDATIRPLCGEWGDSRNWTKVRASVTCPKCLERLRSALAGAP